MKVYHLEDKNDSLEDDATFVLYSKVAHRSDSDIAKQILDGKIENLFYNHVANVDSTSLDHVFMLTNSIDEYWGENVGVEDLTTGCRSTSVGDIIEDNAGAKFLVCDLGFKEIV